MDHQALDICHIRQEGEDLQTIDESVGFLLAAFDAEGEDGRSAVRKILLVQRVIGMVREGGMTDLLHLRMSCQKLHHLLRILRVPLQAQGQGLEALQKQERVER